MINGADAIRKTLQLLRETTENNSTSEQLEELHQKTVVGSLSIDYVDLKRRVANLTNNWSSDNHKNASTYYKNRCDILNPSVSPEKSQFAHSVSPKYDEYYTSYRIHYDLSEVKKTMKGGSLVPEASLAMTPVGGGKIRQVEKPPKAAKASTKPKAVDPGKSGSKSAKPPKKTKKSSKRKDEHIEGDSHTLNFKHGDQDLTGWIEDRGDGTFDVAVVCGKFTVVKGASKDDVVKKVKAAAAKLCGGKEIEEGKPDEAGEDMLYHPKTKEKIDGEIEDKDDKETDEYFPWFFRSKDKKNKNTKKSKKKNKRMED